MISCQYTQGRNIHSGIWVKIRQLYWWQRAFVVDKNESLCYFCVQDPYVGKTSHRVIEILEH